jgi:hypothetical protein
VIESAFVAFAEAVDLMPVMPNRLTIRGRNPSPGKGYHRRLPPNGLIGSHEFANSVASDAQRAVNHSRFAEKERGPATTKRHSQVLFASERVAFTGEIER